MQPRKLEQYKYFQPIAWTLCLSFAGFVTLLSLQLQSTVANLEESKLNFDERLNVLEEKVGLDQR